jgi:hypothetical protein
LLASSWTLANLGRGTSSDCGGHFSSANDGDGAHSDCSCFVNNFIERINYLVDVSPMIYLIYRKFQCKQQVAESNVQSHLLLSKVNLSSAYGICIHRSAD